MKHRRWRASGSGWFARRGRAAALALGALCAAAAQQQTAPPQTPPAAQTPAAQTPAPNQNVAETATREEAATFRTHVNLVMVPVVVRDKKGKAIGNLTKQDFQLFDRGKPQEITRFSVEKAGEKPKDIAPEPQPGAAAEESGKPAVAPDNFIAYLFDDIHIEPGDLMRIRDAARRHMDALGERDRAGVYTTSGQVTQEFTDDRDKLHQALARLMPRSITRSLGHQCPDIDYYMADMIENKNMPDAKAAATADAIACASLSGPGAAQTAAMMVESAARISLTDGNQETQITLYTLLEMVRRMATAPGKRTILLLSPGFYTPEQQMQKMDIFDRAIRANVIIGSLDARGLWTDSTYDASQPAVAQGAMRVKALYAHEAAVADADVLEEMAYGTGGDFIQNSNDLDAGLQRLATPPDTVYHLGFSPQNLKMDGGYHGLKVVLKAASKIPGADLNARKGYYAPTHSENEAENARREIEEAVFSREETQEIPVRLRTQFFKPTEKTAKLAVLAHIDIRGLKFRQADGRNLDNVTVLSALFDRNGNYVKGISKAIEFHLKDDTLQNRLGPGIDVRTVFDLEPGAYLVRLVVRDSEGSLMSALNGAVDIPF
jgi:VWFA-related protein